MKSILIALLLAGSVDAVTMGEFEFARCTPKQATHFDENGQEITNPTDMLVSAKISDNVG